MPHKDREKRNACKRNWNRAHPEYFVQWHKDHPDFLKEQIKKIGKLRRTNRDVRNRLKNNRLVSLYGMTRDEYEAKWMEQGGVCAICHQPETRINKSGYLKALYVDHKHDETKQVRGLLCNQCNAALGFMKEDISILLSAVEYLKKWAEFPSSENKKEVKETQNELTHET